MRKRKLRSVLVAVFSAVVAFGALSGLAGAKGDTRAGDSSWGLTHTTVTAAKDSSWGSGAAVTNDDSSWG
ncbi:hypothetical protein J7E95_42330 [Streptomyces sp. ISL-14]|nr:hypothetical protein [Streptomyces sp. ISL-14]